MSTGADNKTMPVTAAYEDGYERAFSERDTRRGRFVYRPGHPKANKWGSVHVDDLGDWQTPEEAAAAPIMAGRFYENAVTWDGVDIGSRQRRAEYMKQRGLADYDDYKGVWQKAEKLRKDGDPAERTVRRDLIGKIAYEMEKKRARR